MEYYVGLDVSLKQTSICVVDQTGSVVREGVVDSDPEAISVYVKSKAPDAVRIGLETGPTSTWLWTELKRLGLPVICIDARHATLRHHAEGSPLPRREHWARQGRSLESLTPRPGIREQYLPTADMLLGRSNWRSAVDTEHHFAGRS